MRRGIVVAAVTLLTIGSGVAFAYFQVSSSNPQTATAKADFLPPTISRGVIQKDEGGITGWVRATGSYRAYSHVTDSGNPSSGISSVTTDLSAISTAASAIPQTSGSWTLDGLAYNYRTASTLVAAGTTTGSKNWSVTATDGNSQSTTKSDLTVQVDNTAPSASDILTANASGGQAGRPEQNDTLTYVYSEPIDPHSVIAGWNGTATTVTAEIKDARVATVGNDIFTLRDGATTILGTVDFQGNYAGNNKTITYTNSSMAISGNNIVITLGTWNSAARRDTGNNSPTWNPTTSTYDRAGNTMPATPKQQNPPARVQF